MVFEDRVMNVSSRKKEVVESWVNPQGLISIKQSFENYWRSPEHVILCRDAIIADVVSLVVKFRERQVKKPGLLHEIMDIAYVSWEVHGIHDGVKEEVFLGLCSDFHVATEDVYQSLYEHLKAQQVPGGRHMETPTGVFQLDRPQYSFGRQIFFLRLLV